MPDEAPKKNIKPVIEEIVEDVPASAPSEPVATEAPKEVVHEVVTEPETTPLNTSPTNPAQVPPPSPKKEPFKISLGFIAVVVIVAIIVALITGALYVYFNGINSLRSGNPSPTPTVEPSTQPEASPSASGSPVASPSGSPSAVSGYKVQVLNGSGQSGAAGKGADLLEEEGFKITNTGNASNFNFKTTTIQAKAGVPDAVVLQAQSALEDTYEVTVATQDLATSSSYDIIVTVGAE